MRAIEAIPAMPKYSKSTDCRRLTDSGKLFGSAMKICFFCSIWLCAATAHAGLLPNQPSFYSVPSAARLYPYTFPDVVNGPYTVVVDYTDPDGAADLQHTYLQLKGDGPAQTIMYANLSSASKWAGEGDHLYSISASKSAIANGYRVTYTFQIKGDWTPIVNVDFDAWALDKGNLQSAHRSYDWNGIYDNNPRIYAARKLNLVDNDGDGYYSSVRIEADANTSVSSRPFNLLLYQRDSNAGGSGSLIWQSGSYTTSGATTDYKGTTITVTSRGIYDFGWELYDPVASGWFLANRWYDVDSDISNIPMEPASEDISITRRFVDQFMGSSVSHANWLVADNQTIVAGNWAQESNIIVSDGIAEFSMFNDSDPAHPKRGAQINTIGSNRYGLYLVRIRAEEGTGATTGFFTYLERPSQGLSGNNLQEIDIEIYGEDPGHVHFTVWYNDPSVNGAAGEGKRLTADVAVDTREWHEYGFEWESDHISFLVDKVVQQLLVEYRDPSGGDYLYPIPTYQPSIRPEDFAAVPGWGVNYLPDQPAPLLVNTWVHTWGGAPFTGLRKSWFDYVNIPLPANITFISKDGLCNGHSPCWRNIQNGISQPSVLGPSIIEITQETYNEDIVLDFDEEIVLEGGWDTDFRSCSSYTTVNGSITVKRGTMIIENIWLK